MFFGREVTTMESTEASFAAYVLRPRKFLMVHRDDPRVRDGPTNQNEEADDENE